MTGTAILVALGTGSIVAAGRFGPVPQWVLGIAWFVAVLVPTVLFADVSGAHLNPVVTLALAIRGRTQWRLLPPYWAAQFAGAFSGSAVVLVSLGAGHHLGATIPRPDALPLAFSAEAGFTALLVGAVLYLADRGPGHRRWRLALPAIAVGVSTYVIGPLTGSSLNPARTVAPAVVSGTYSGIWLYLTAVPLSAIAVAIGWSAMARVLRSPRPVAR